jgi:peptidase E
MKKTNSHKKVRRQIIAMGGGSFMATPDNPVLELYALSQTRKSNPAVCFLPTATGDAPTYIAKFYATFSERRCRPTHISFFERTPRLREILLTQDLIYVGGGNTKSMLAVWREWQLPDILRQAWNSGIVLAGVSAGAICWFDVGVTDSWAEQLAPLPCLGWLPGTCCPHYDGEVDRRPAVHEFVAKGRLPQTLALDDGAAAHFVGRKLKRIVCSRPTAGAYLVRRLDRKSVETKLPVSYLKN